jgi:hypothetical protein
MSTVQDFDPSVNALSAILWEHDKAEKLVLLTQLKQAWYEKNQSQFWADWLRNVFNIDTANDFGLGVWSRILDIPFEVPVASTVGTPRFGFGTHNKNFGKAGFGRATAGTQALSVEQKRTVIKLRYFQLTARGVVTETNAFMAKMFGDGAVFVTDPYDMTFVTYIFKSAPDASLRFILENYDLLPRPSAVGVQYRVQPKPSFGFGTHHLNFERGNFGG